MDDEDEHFQFFDAPEEILQECTGDCGKICEYEYDVWVRTPKSVDERRRNFIGLMGLNTLELGEKILSTRLSAKDFDRVVDDDVRTEVEYPCSSMSKSNMRPDNQIFTRGVSFSELTTQCRTVESSSNKNNNSLRKIRTTRLAQLLSADKFREASHPSPTNTPMKQKTAKGDCSMPTKMGRLKDRWLQKWHMMRCNINRSTRADNMVKDSLSQPCAARIRRVKVKHCRRKLKELSALFTGQTIQAHNGSILTMKFSPDGRYLASAGEDRIVKVWQVMEDERSDTVDIPEADPSCVYLSVNHLAELEPLMVEKDEFNKPKNLRKNADSACVIFPPKVFRILEKPLHIFRGHAAEVLDLSWSKDNRLLSASVDKTVRLWRVGIDQCLRVFNHTDYVTCIQFNPIHDDYFISGSIDGKVRIWTISGCQVVEWAEMRDIVTAVSYRPDGQGGIVGSITGNCRLFNLSGNIFVLEMDTCLTSKKKSPCKRITGFQFFPQDPSKVLVTSADSHVRILDGSNVIGKFRGLRKSGNYVSATLTSDGKHIVSASDDSNVYIWNYIPDKEPSFSQTKVIKSFECFVSDTSIAIPWSSLKTGTLDSAYLNSLPFWSSTCFSLTREYLVDTGSKGSATWPEENLPPSSPSSQATPSPLSKSQYKLFKTSYNNSLKIHAWGLVIVTAGWDGRIRSFQNYGLPVPV